MKARTCFVQIWIANDKGEKACYSLRTMPSDELGESAAGFFLTKLGCDPAPVYAVRVDVEGLVVCNCPEGTKTGKCKHADSLVASAVLPVGLLYVLKSRNRLINHAEAEVLRLADAANEERQLHDHDSQWRADRIADLSELVDRLNAREEAQREQIEQVEADAKSQSKSVANLLASVSQLNDRCRCLQQMVDESQDEILRLEKPKPRRPRKVAA